MSAVRWRLLQAPARSRKAAGRLLRLTTGGGGSLYYIYIHLKILSLGYKNTVPSHFDFNFPEFPKKAANIHHEHGLLQNVTRIPYLLPSWIAVGTI